MSSYGDQTGQPGQQPPSPWSQQPGTPPPPPPGQGAPNPYGAPAGGYGAPTGYGQQSALPYSFWGKRVGATLIDGLLTALFFIPFGIGLAIAFSDLQSTTDEFGNVTTTGEVNPIGIAIAVIGILGYLGFYVWNTFVKQGRTGYTIGKGVLGIKLVREADGQPIGGGMAFVRQICHILDGFCYIGYLWPLWDSKRQTFADKIINTVVLDIPKG